MMMPTLMLLSYDDDDGNGDDVVVVARSAQRHCSTHLKFLPHVLRSHQLLLLRRLPRQVSR